MLHVSDTAYPRLKAHPSIAELESTKNLVDGVVNLTRQAV